MPVLLRSVYNFLGQVIGNASKGKYNTVNNSSSGEVTFQKCLKSGITLFSSKNSNKSQTFATGAYQRLHEARPRRVVWPWEPEYHDQKLFFDVFSHINNNSRIDNTYHKETITFRVITLIFKDLSTLRHFESDFLK